jgi:hypothetical protein
MFSPDGKSIFFQSDDDRNIYWVDAKIIEELRLKERFTFRDGEWKPGHVFELSEKKE